MRVRHHYCIDERESVVEFLKRYQISYEVIGMVGDKTIIFDIYEDQYSYEMFKKSFPMLSISSFKNLEFSKEDIEKSKWLMVSCRGTNVEYVFQKEAFQYSCPYKIPFHKKSFYRHFKQISNLTVEKNVKWGKRQFFSGPNSMENIIFCSERTKNILENRWEGLQFKNVINKKGNDYIDDLYQLFFENAIPFSAFVNAKSVRCHKCRKKMILVSDCIFKIKEEYLQDSSKVYQTGEVITDGRIFGETVVLYIVPQEFYRYCEERGMNRGMDYRPVELV